MRQFYRLVAYSLCAYLASALKKMEVPGGGGVGNERLRKAFTSLFPPPRETIFTAP